MLSRLKKKSEAAALVAPAWHPNFRNYQKLPDIKVIRTAFFINGAAISITLLLAIVCGFREWQLHDLRSQRDEAVARSARDKPASDQAVANFKKFQAEEARIVEVDAFVKSRPLLSPLLTHLGETLPPDVAVDSFELRETGLILRLSVRGDPQEASGTVTAYKDQLMADQRLAETFGEPTFGNFAPDPASGRLAVEIRMPAKAAKK